MQTSSSKYYLYLLIIGLFITTTISSAQRGRMEKIEQLKKVKLLEELNLDEQTADKFLVKLNTYDKILDEKRDAVDEAFKGLHEKVKKEAPAKEIETATNDLLTKQDEFHKAMKERVDGIRTLLTTEQFAKFLLVEKHFFGELKRHISDRLNEGRGPRRR